MGARIADDTARRLAPYPGIRRGTALLLWPESWSRATTDPTASQAVAEANAPRRGRLGPPPDCSTRMAITSATRGVGRLATADRVVPAGHMGAMTIALGPTANTASGRCSRRVASRGCTGRHRFIPTGPRPIVLARMGQVGFALL